MSPKLLKLQGVIAYHILTKGRLTRKLVVLFFILNFLCIGCMNNQKSSKTAHLFGQENAVWTESIYLRGYKPSSGEKLTDAHLKNYAKILEDNRIKYAYLFAGPYQKDGHLPDYPFSYLAKESVKKLKQYYPEIIILPWIGGVQNKTVYLGDSTWVENALQDTKKMVQFLDVPGVHIDFEYILKGDSYLDTTIEMEKFGDKDNYGDNVNSFHKTLRLLIPDSFVSSVVVATAPDTKPWKRKTSIDELLELTSYVDQISFLYYDTYISSQNLFKKNCVEQIKDIETLKKSNPYVQYLLSIGTFINRPELRKYRNLKIESISNSLETIKQSTIQVNATNKLIDGISIFCDWQTENEEWNEFYTNWVEQ